MTLDYVCIGSLWISIAQLKHILWSKYMRNRGPMLWNELKLTLTIQSIYGASMNDFQQVVRKLLTQKSYLWDMY